MSLSRWHSDERGLVLSWLLRILAGLAVTGLILFDVGAILVNYFTLDSVADEIALSVGTFAGEATVVAPNTTCTRRSPVPICREAAELARVAGARLIDATFDAEGNVTIRVRRTADTLMVSRIGVIEGWGVARASARASTN